METDRTGKTPLPQTILSHYTVKVNGKPFYTQARVTQLNGWTYMERMTVPMADVTVGQLMAEMAWTMLLVHLVDGPDSI